MDNEEFTSLAGENDFWCRSIENKMPDGYPLEPFFFEENNHTIQQINKELRANAIFSDVFVLIIRVNVENAICEIFMLARDKTWQITRWENVGYNDCKISVSKPSTIREDVLLHLSDKGIYIDASDTWIFHADSVYVFMQYKGKRSRFAVYNPQYEDASHYDSDDDTRNKIEKDAVAALLKSLYEMTGMNVMEIRTDQSRNKSRNRSRRSRNRDAASND